MKNLKLRVDVSQSISRSTNEGAASGNDFDESKAVPALTSSSTESESPYIVSPSGSFSSFEDLAEDPYYEENISSLVAQPYTKMDVDLNKYRKEPENLTCYVERIQSYPHSYGGFGNIWKCKLKSITRNGIKMPPQNVAVKAFRVPSRDPEDMKRLIKKLRQEVFVWQGLENSHILPLYGTADGFDDVLPALVCPWMKKGSLHHFLNTVWRKNFPPPEMQCLFLLLFQVVSGLQYLHSKDITHGDLMPSNVLIDENGNAVLADFGLSRLADHETSFFASYSSGAIRWAAPEIIEFGTEKPNEYVGKPNKESDIYSFGCIMMQVLSGCSPYFDMKCESSVTMAKFKGTLPTRPTLPAIADVYWRYIEQCWSTHVRMRPSVEQVLDYITAEHDRQKLIS